MVKFLAESLIAVSKNFRISGRISCIRPDDRYRLVPVSVFRIPFLAQSVSGASRAVDPHSFFADRDPAVLLNADPDLDPA